MLIGSRAIAHWNKDFKVSPNADWDIIGYQEEEDMFRELLSIPKGDRIEWHDELHLNNKELSILFDVDGICNPYGLAIIYRSHLHRDHRFESHITKYHKFIIPLLGDKHLHLVGKLLKERIRLTKMEYPQGNPNLNQSNMDFFDDSVVKVFDHDYIHELYAYEDRPMFERLKHEGEEGSAWCAKDLWLGLSTTQKLQCVAEEVQVIATERFLLGDKPKPVKLAYFLALNKVCTTLCSGWFRDFAIDNYPLIVDMFDKQRIEYVVANLKEQMQ